MNEKEKHMITIDIVSPVGGLYGGVENVIKLWTEYMDGNDINLRVFHMYRGTAYLKGYSKTYYIDKTFEKADYAYCVEAYKVFVEQDGDPDVCIATNWPMVSRACAQVRDIIKSDMKIISWVHNTICEYDKAGLGNVNDLLYADVHFAISNIIADEIRKKDAKARIYTVWNPVKTDVEIEKEHKENVIAYVGRLSYIKRLDVILEAMYRAKSRWKLKIVGDGEIREEVENWIKILKLGEQVEIIGWSGNPWKECEDAGVLVMASEYEGFSMTAIEAAAHGKTIITTEVGGVTDFIVPGINGYFFEQENAQQLADILDRISENNYKLADVEVCRHSVEKFSVKNYFDRVRKIIEDIVR